MMSRGTYFLLAAAIGLGALLVSVGLTYLLLLSTTNDYGALLAALLSLVFSILFMRWLGARVDAIWRQPTGNPRAAELLTEVSRRTPAYLAASITIVFVAYAIIVLLFLPPDQFDIPLQPIVTFALSGAWFCYIIYALSRLVSPEGNKIGDIAVHARRSVIGAIVLSIFFLIPFDWFAQSGYRAFETVVYGVPTGRQFSYSSGSSTINWLQSTAIPSIVSIGFGFLVAYVTSLIWYEYYKAFTSVGLVTVEASRKGRDPSQDDFWFGQLKQAETRAILCGATLGGWFRNWNRLRSSLHELLARESVEQITIMLPEPGNPFFWQRRADELSRERSLWDDPIARLAAAIEMLYLVLPEPDGDKQEDVLDFLCENSLTQNTNGLSEFADRFRTEFSAKLTTFEDNQDNKNFSKLAHGFLTAAASRVKKIKSVQGVDVETSAVGGKVSFLFVRGSMMGVNIFDDQVHFTPYLPKTEDRQCPKFTIESQAPLGRSIERALNGMSNDAVWLFNRSHALAVAFRLWQVCRERGVDLPGLSDIPAWLLANNS